MKLGTVIGRVTLSKTVPALEGGRFLIVSPFGREQYERGLDAPVSFGKDFTPVVYDAIGGGVGQVIGYIEGREAAQPFPQPDDVHRTLDQMIEEGIVAEKAGFHSLQVPHRHARTVTKGRGAAPSGAAPALAARPA